MSEMNPQLTLNNGVVMPALGLGVFQSPLAETASAVEVAVQTGYRLIDTAAAYANEREVGEGIRRSGIDRSEIFIESKVWISDYGYDETLLADGRVRAIIPKSVRPERITESVDVFDFELSVGELARIDALDTGVRGGPEPDEITLEVYGRPIPEA